MLAFPLQVAWQALEPVPVLLAQGQHQREERPAQQQEVLLAQVQALARPAQQQVPLAWQVSFVAALLAQPAWPPSPLKKRGKQDSGATPNAGRSSGDANVLQQTSDPPRWSRSWANDNLCNAGALYTPASHAGKTRIANFNSTPATSDNSHASGLANSRLSRARPSSRRCG